MIPFLSATFSTLDSGNEYQKGDHGGRMATVLHSPCRTHWSSGHVHHAGRPELTLERKETTPTDTLNDASHSTRVPKKIDGKCSLEVRKVRKMKNGKREMGNGKWAVSNTSVA